MAARRGKGGEKRGKKTGTRGEREGKKKLRQARTFKEEEKKSCRKILIQYSIQLMISEKPFKTLIVSFRPSSARIFAR